MTAAAKLTRKDFMSDQEVRWCPGCGDYAILATVQRAFADMGMERENTVFVSGIGCAARFPYYMNTYGFHSIHGRAPAIALGVKLAKPELSVWIASGDGDALSIGGNHLIHMLRRNPDIKVLLFNNRIYGLTKGQFSPTSEVGKNTKSSPWGNIDGPLNPLSVALGANASFAARTVDRDPKHMLEVIKAANAHKGTSIIEILQNCNIFNDGTFENITGRSVKHDSQLLLEAGQPLIFGKERDKGIRVDKDGNPEVVQVGEGGVDPSELVLHDPMRSNPSYAFMLAHLDLPRFPVPLGILRAVERPVYEQSMHAQIQAAREKSGTGDLNKLIRGGDTWEVSA
jgi:2-oxoglutarate ferredoxin oxidoreductase subunit beta